MKNSEWMIEQKCDFAALNANEDKGGERWRIYMYGKVVDTIKKEPYESSCYHAILRWLDEEHKVPILTEKEHDYLESVIEPWRKDVISISKKHRATGDYIRIESPVFYTVFPCFPVGSMYKGMELDRDYTLDDLDL